MTIPGIALFYGGLIRARERAVNVNASDRHLCAGLYFMGGVRLFAGFWRRESFLRYADGAMLKNIALTAVTVRFIGIFVISVSGSFMP